MIADGYLQYEPEWESIYAYNHQDDSGGRFALEDSGLLYISTYGYFHYGDGMEYIWYDDGGGDHDGDQPENDYRPNEPYTVSVSEDANSYTEEGYANLFIPSGGADSPRPVKLRLAKDGKWYLWEQYLLTGIRQPESRNPWA